MVFGCFCSRSYFRGRTTADVLSISARRQRKHSSEGEQPRKCCRSPLEGKEDTVPRENNVIWLSSPLEGKVNAFPREKQIPVCGIWLFLLEIFCFRGRATGFAVSARRTVQRESEHFCSFCSRHLYWLYSLRFLVFILVLFYPYLLFLSLPFYFILKLHNKSFVVNSYLPSIPKLTPFGT